MNKRKSNILLSAILILSGFVYSCGNEDAINLVLPDDSNSQQIVQTYNTEIDYIKSQIKTNTISKTEWGVNVKKLPVPKQPKKVTLLSYLAFDNDKSSDREELKPMINLHELTGSSDVLNQILLTDGYQDSDSRRYYVINDKNEDDIASPYIQSKRELNTGYYLTLASFIKWGYTNFPGKTKILDINDHGVAYAGIAVDSTSNSMISLPDLAKAIKSGAGKVDILNMDACLMSTIEAAYELRNLVDVIVSSEDNTLNTGMNYAKHLNEILANSKTNEEIALNIMKMSDRTGKDLSFYGQDKVPNVFTVSAVKASDVDRLAYHMNRLSKMLLNKMEYYKQAVKTGLAQTHKLTVNALDSSDMGQRNLHEVLARIEIELKKTGQIKNDPDILNAIQDAREAANRAIIVAMNHSSEKWAEGMAINISPYAVTTTDYTGTSFAKDFLWDEMITAVYK